MGYSQGRVHGYSGPSAGLAVLLVPWAAGGVAVRGIGGPMRLLLGVGAGVVYACLRVSVGMWGGKLLHLHRYMLFREEGWGETGRGRAGREGRGKERGGGERWRQKD